MLSSGPLATPRPRPPAKVRRTPSLNFPPPPPYAPRMDMILDSPIGVTAQLVGTNGSRTPNPTPAIEEWMNERSREELSDLLFKADGLIKSRETELGLTSALCKSLYHNNVALQNKHEALLARLPSNSAQGSSSSPLPSPSPTPSPLSQSPHYYSASLPMSPIDTPLSNSPPLPRIRHARKISVSPGEIALLADQNAELLDKLEQLEEESGQADQAGKRKLRKLEREIQGLREELERTQAKGAELEEQAKASFAMSESDLQRRKEAREERMRGLREKASSSSDTINEEIKDFAPASELPRSSSLKAIPEVPDSPAPTVNLSTKPTFTTVNNLEDSEASSYFPPVDMPEILSAPHPEYAVISQLLLKIRELEETNAQITKEQKMNADRLRLAQRDSESIRRAYDCLTEDGELRVVSDGVPATSHLTGSDTVRFSSLRRTIDGDLMSEDDEEFDSGIFDNMQSTTRSIISPIQNKPTAGHKTRKSVVGLFDSDGQAHQGSSVQAPYPSTLEVSPAFRCVSPLPDDPVDISIWSTAATEGVSLASPTISSLGLTFGQSPVDGSGRQHTLGSELGSEFGEDWGENAGNHHLRTSSLYDLAGMVGSREGTPSPSPGTAPVEKPSFLSSPEAPNSDVGWEDVEYSPPVSVAGSSTPARGRGLQLVVQPPTPKLPKLQDQPSVGGSLRESRTSRNYRLSQTVRARTDRWVEGRYADSTAMVRKRRPPMKAGSRALDASMVFNETFDTVVRQLSFSGGVPGEFDHEEEEEAETTIRDIVHQRSIPDNSVVLPPPRKDGFVGFILEVWLWLQFAIVVLVFLWAMAKRGPKSVLQEAEKRKGTHHGGSC